MQDPIKARSTGNFVIKAKGVGEIAISKYGGLFRLSLGEGDIYYVNPSRLVAWHSTLAPKPANVETRDYEIVTDDTQSQPRFSIIRSLISWLRNIKAFFSAKDQFWKITGPGDVYLCSRIEPTFNFLEKAKSSRQFNEVKKLEEEQQKK